MSSPTTSTSPTPTPTAVKVQHAVVLARPPRGGSSVWRNPAVGGVLLLLAAVVPLSAGQDNVEVFGNRLTWSYSDTGEDLSATPWNTVSFDDSAWSTGEAEFGYGDGDEGTVVSFGTNANRKFTTTYFRREFDFEAGSPNPPATSLVLNILADDGAVAYLNGVEVARFNLPEGEITGATFASSQLGRPEEAAFNAFPVPLSGDGAVAVTTTGNVLAIEIHQGSLSSSDMSFDAFLEMVPLPSPSNTPSVSPTVSVTPTNRPATLSNTPTNTPTISVTPSITPTISVTSSITPTISVTPTVSVSPSETMSPTPSISVTPSVTPTPGLLDASDNGLRGTSGSKFHNSTFMTVGAAVLVLGAAVAGTLAAWRHRKQGFACGQPGTLNP